MAKHNQLGAEGEQAVALYLSRQGYLLLDRNWRRGHLELDIVAEKDATLIIIEVKTRSTTDFGNPEDAVDERKMRNIVLSTDTYIKQKAIDMPVRFDIISVVRKDGQLTIDHIEDAFYAPLE